MIKLAALLIVLSICQATYAADCWFVPANWAGVRDGKLEVQADLPCRYNPEHVEVVTDGQEVVALHVPKAKCELQPLNDFGTGAVDPFRGCCLVSLTFEVWQVKPTFRFGHKLTYPEYTAFREQRNAPVCDQFQRPVRNCKEDPGISGCTISGT